MDELDRKRLQYLAFTARGCFAPLCAFLGGVVAQEALKALTGKFSPLNQWVSSTSRECPIQFLLSKCTVYGGLK